MLLFIPLLFLLLCFCSVLFRLVITNPYNTIWYALNDAFYSFIHRSSRSCPYGTIKCYVAHRGTAFGTGKTLSAVREVVRAYNKYNGLSVWCDRRQAFVRQRIHILSNVEIKACPYERLDSLAQWVGETDDITQFDDEHNCLTVFYVLIDEASSQLNSRSFKSNFDAPFISRLLTARHVHANLILTSQRPGMVDKLMRDCTNYYISCQKLWRFEILRYYDAYAIETATDPTTIAPLHRKGYFISNDLFSNYDTFAQVQALKKSCMEGDMLSEDEILALRSGDSLLQPERPKLFHKRKK